MSKYSHINGTWNGLQDDLGIDAFVFGFRNPPVSETVWRGLLQDLLDMQQNVYKCLKAEMCHQVLCLTQKLYVYIKQLDNKSSVTLPREFPNVKYAS